MYKLKRAFIAVLLLLSLAVAANAKAEKPKENDLYDKGHKSVLMTSYPVKENAVYKAKIKRVVDGDTAIIYFLTDDGTRYKEERILFIGVNTPETVDPNRPVEYYGKEASDFTKSTLTGRRVWLEYDASPTDRYDRHLAYIWLVKPSDINETSIRRDMFNAILLLDGYAKTMIIKPNTRYAKLFGEVQDEARRERKGLWSE